MKQNYETGRSMVEMLGTLAIIGVLSVGGIVGYSYGMDKYRANTIINDIMLRAIDVNAQFDSTGDANLSEWPTTTVGKYAIGLENETIGIQVSDLPKRLCEMVFEGMINNATVKIGTTEYDSAIDDVCGNTNTMVFYVDDTLTSTTEETTTTPITTTTEETTTTTIAPSGGCTSNSECNPNEYCAASSPTASNPFPDGKKGVCTLVDFNKHTITVNGKTEIWYVSQYEMSYWEAVYACQRLNATIASAHDLYKNWTGRHFSTFELNDRANALAVACGLGSTYIQVSERTSNGLIYQIELAYGYMTGPSGSDYSYTNGGRDGGTAHVLCYEGTLADLE